MLNSEEKLDPRVRRTRRVLVEAFSELLVDSGFSAISVYDVTARAGVNRATFYAHFPDKYALLDYFIREAFHREMDQHLFSDCHFSLENLRLLIVTVCEFVGNVHSHCVTTEAQFYSLVEGQIRNQVYELLLYWLNNMDLVQTYTVSRERAATAASWAIYGLAQDWSRSKRSISAEQYAEEVLPLIAANLGQTIELV